MLFSLPTLRMQTNTTTLISQLQDYNHGQLMQLLLLSIAKNPTIMLPLLKQHTGDANLNNLQAPTQQVMHHCIIILENCSAIALYGIIVKCAMQSAEFVTAILCELNGEKNNHVQQQYQSLQQVNLYEARMVRASLKHCSHGQLMQLVLLILAKNPQVMLPLLQQHFTMIRFDKLQPQQIFLECLLVLESCSDSMLYAMMVKFALQSREFAATLKQELDSNMLQDAEQHDAMEQDDEPEQPATASTKRNIRAMSLRHDELIALADEAMPANLHTLSREELQNLPFEYLRAFCAKLKLLCYHCSKAIFARILYEHLHGVPANVQSMREKYNKMSNSELANIKGMPQASANRSKVSMVEHAIELELNKK